MKIRKVGSTLCYFTLKTNFPLESLPHELFKEYFYIDLHRASYQVNSDFARALRANYKKAFAKTNFFKYTSGGYFTRDSFNYVFHQTLLEFFETGYKSPREVSSVDPAFLFSRSGCTVEDASNYSHTKTSIRSAMVRKRNLVVRYRKEGELKSKLHIVKPERFLTADLILTRTQNSYRTFHVEQITELVSFKHDFGGRKPFSVLEVRAAQLPTGEIEFAVQLHSDEETRPARHAFF